MKAMVNLFELLNTPVDDKQNFYEYQFTVVQEKKKKRSLYTTVQADSIYSFFCGRRLIVYDLLGGRIGCCWF